MSAATNAHTGTTSSSTSGLLSLSPELILEIASHVVSWDDFRAGRRDSTLLSEGSVFPVGQATLAALRLVCRYLGEVLEREVFRSITFNFHITHASEVDIESQLALLTQGGSPASRHVMFLHIKCLDPIPVDGYFMTQQSNFDREMQAKAASLVISRNLHLEKAILSFQYLCSVAWNIEYDNEQSTRVISVLSTLPSLKDLTLQVGPQCHDPTGLSLNKFNDLSSLAISFNNYPPAYADESGKHQEQVVDHISQIIAQSPMLRYLNVLQPGPFQSVYDLSLHNLLKKVPAAQPLAHLESLHLALPDMKLDNNTLRHLTNLKTLRIEGSAVPNCTGAEIWGSLTAAQIKLQEITVSHLSEPLDAYLASYSGLKKFHVLLTYYANESTRCDIRAFIRDILPLHGLSPTVDSAPLGHQIRHSSQNGLHFEIDTPKQSLSTKVLSWPVAVCIDSVPDALPFVLESACQSPQCNTERLEISYSPTTTYFGCGHGMSQHYRINTAAGKEWLSNLEVKDHQHYPPIISLNRKVFELKPCEGGVGMYKYQVMPRTEGFNYNSDSDYDY